MGLPQGEVSLYAVLEWAQDQAKYLTPTQTHVLWYLCINAWRKPDNREGLQPGQVMTGRTAMRQIRKRTGLSERAVRNALVSLQEAGYVISEHQPGHGISDISVFWQEGDDEFREDLRTGVRVLPAVFRRAQTPEKKERPLAVILPFDRHEVPQ